ncbi:MAG: stage II sporulation protein M [Clostridia bacterium]|nr:stage II sporulation protein M [Clostridia bacterium]
MQNILFIPCILMLAVSGMKIHNSIMEDRRRENIKVEILRHTIFSLFVLILLIVSSLIEVYISKNLLLFLIKYI